MQSIVDFPFWKPNWFCDKLFSFSDHFVNLFNKKLCVYFCKYVNKCYPPVIFGLISVSAFENRNNDSLLPASWVFAIAE